MVNLLFVPAQVGTLFMMLQLVQEEGQIRQSPVRLLA